MCAPSATSPPTIGGFSKETRRSFFIGRRSSSSAFSSHQKKAPQRLTLGFIFLELQQRNYSRRITGDSITAVGEHPHHAVVVAAEPARGTGERVATVRWWRAVAVARAGAMRVRGSRRLLPREGRILARGQAHLRAVHGAAGVSWVRARERRALRDLGRAFRKRAPPPEEARVIDLPTKDGEGVTPYATEKTSGRKEAG